MPKNLGFFADKFKLKKKLFEKNLPWPSGYAFEGVWSKNSGFGRNGSIEAK
jgi:hypothetical protein